jgi:hypothetical protein
MRFAVLIDNGRSFIGLASVDGESPREAGIGEFFCRVTA